MDPPKVVQARIVDVGGEAQQIEIRPESDSHWIESKSMRVVLSGKPSNHGEGAFKVGSFAYEQCDDEAGKVAEKWQGLQEDLAHGRYASTRWVHCQGRSFQTELAEGHEP